MLLTTYLGVCKHLQQEPILCNTMDMYVLVAVSFYQWLHSRRDIWYRVVQIVTGTCVFMSAQSKLTVLLSRWINVLVTEMKS